MERVIAYTTIEMFGVSTKRLLGIAWRVETKTTNNPYDVSDRQVQGQPTPYMYYGPEVC